MSTNNHQSSTSESNAQFDIDNRQPSTNTFYSQLTYTYLPTMY